MWHRYGGRGIQFYWESTARAAEWVSANIGLEKAKQLDRIDNNLGYQPGNLRWATSEENNRNREGVRTPSDFVYKQEEWPYVETKVKTFIGQGMTREQILKRAVEAVTNRRKSWRRFQEWFDMNGFTTS